MENIDRSLRHCRITGKLPYATEKPYNPLAIIPPGLELSHSGRGYWIVKGRVSLDLAKKIYADPVGRDLIRAVGHCGCVPPEAPWVEWFMPDGKRVLPVKERDECNGCINSKSQMMVAIARKILDECLFSDDPAGIGALGYVTLYHIDGDLGLRVFVDMVQATEQI